MPERSHSESAHGRKRPVFRFPFRPRAKPRKTKRSGAAHARTGDKLYTTYAGMYDLIFDHVLRSGRKAAVEMLEAKPGDRVLEVGVGTGLSFRFYPRGVHLTGIDKSPAMLKEARRRLRKLERTDIRVMEMDALHLDFKDGAFDKIMASHVLSAVPEPVAAFEEIARVCAPGGRIVIANRFQSRVPMLRAAERAMNPLTKKMGFVLDLDLEMLTRDPALRIDRMRKVNVPGLWSVVRLVKTARAAALVS